MLVSMPAVSCVSITYGARTSLKCFTTSSSTALVICAILKQNFLGYYKCSVKKILTYSIMY